MQVWYNIMEGDILTRLREPFSIVSELIEYKIMLCWSELIMISINMSAPDVKEQNFPIVISL